MECGAGRKGIAGLWERSAMTAGVAANWNSQP